MSILSKISFIKLVSKGFSNEYATFYLKQKGSMPQAEKEYFYRYCYIHSQNDVFGKWLLDKSVSRIVFDELQEAFPKSYFLIYKRFNALHIIDFRGDAKSQRAIIDDVMDFIKSHGPVAITHTRGLYSQKAEFTEDGFYLNGEAIEKDALLEVLTDSKQVILLEEWTHDNAFTPIRVICQRNECGDLVPSQCYKRKVDSYDYDSIDCFKLKNEIDKDYGRKVFAGIDNCQEVSAYEPDGSLKALVESIGQITPQINFMAMDVMDTASGYIILDMYDHPPYPKKLGFLDTVKEYIDNAYEEKQISQREKSHVFLSKKVDTVFWIIFTKLFCKRKMRPLVFKEWMTVLKKDFFSKNGLSLSKKMAAYKKGFLSYRIKQYGITAENIGKNISDFDYSYLKHINTKYRTVLEDKLTIKYLCKETNQCFPEYYYHISGSEKHPRFLPLMDLPKQYKGNDEDFFSFIEEKKLVACKPQRGSHGVGFIKLTFENGSFYMNNKEASKDKIRATILNPKYEYIVTEYIDLHPVLKKVYPGSVNTMRVICFRNESGEFEIGNMYLRFGNDKTGGVDNMGAGGMFAAVDIESGHFYNGKTIINNIISPCEKHPDTGALIDDYIPDWEQKKKLILDVTKGLYHLEYIGVDVAITSEGIKIPEINRAPEYPAIEKLSPNTIKYLLKLLKQKKNA